MEDARLTKVQNLLLVDTSKRNACVALVVNGEVVGERHWKSERDLGIKLLKEINSLLKDAGISLGDISRVAVHSGPGHYSALRTGVVTATMLAEAADLELVEVTEDTVEGILDEARKARPVEIVKPRYV